MYGAGFSQHNLSVSEFAARELRGEFEDCHPRSVSWLAACCPRSSFWVCLLPTTIFLKGIGACHQRPSLRLGFANEHVCLRITFFVARQNGDKVRQKRATPTSQSQNSKTTGLQVLRSAPSFICLAFGRVLPVVCQAGVHSHREIQDLLAGSAQLAGDCCEISSQWAGLSTQTRASDACARRKHRIACSRALCTKGCQVPAALQKASVHRVCEDGQDKTTADFNRTTASETVDVLLDG